jgi:hypothetical protein
VHGRVDEARAAVDECEELQRLDGRSWLRGCDREELLLAD